MELIWQVQFFIARGLGTHECIRMVTSHSTRICSNMAELFTGSSKTPMCHVQETLKIHCIVLTMHAWQLSSISFRLWSVGLLPEAHLHRNFPDLDVDSTIMVGLCWPGSRDCACRAIEWTKPDASKGAAPAEARGSPWCPAHTTPFTPCCSVMMDCTVLRIGLSILVLEFFRLFLSPG